MSQIDERALSVTKFWRDAGPAAWFTKDAGFDTKFRNNFLELHYAAARRELDGWLDDSESALALMILLDQFPRNCFRGTGHMFATDPLARYYASKSIEKGHDIAVSEDVRVFFYLPLEHSEDIEDQKRSVDLHKANAQSYLKYAVDHLEIIERFGRFPHRNPQLGRQTTADEKAFLDGGGFAG